MAIHSLNLKAVHSSWIKSLKKGLTCLDKNYLDELDQNKNWLPGPQRIFNAFSLPMQKVNYVLLGESPYPREASANGYAFWDAAVSELWSPTGLSKKVNRATSLRNILKMLLIADHYLNSSHCGQSDISEVDKYLLVQTNEELFHNFLHHGFLLLNATLVLRLKQRKKEAEAWLPFMQVVLKDLVKKNPQVKFILLGQVARTVDQLLTVPLQQKIMAEHPYNLSFLKNPHVLDFFRPLHLLRKVNKSNKSDWQINSA